MRVTFGPGSDGGEGEVREVRELGTEEQLYVHGYPVRAIITSSPDTRSADKSYQKLVMTSLVTLRVSVSLATDRDYFSATRLETTQSSYCLYIYYFFTAVNLTVRLLK